MEAAFFTTESVKPKYSSKAVRWDGVKSLKLLSPVKYASFCDAKIRSAHHKFLEAVVCFNAFPRHGAIREIISRCANTCRKAFYRGNIIFINENDDFLLETFGKEQGYIAQGSRKGFIWHRKNTYHFLPGIHSRGKGPFRVMSGISTPSARNGKSGRFHADDIFMAANSVCVCLARRRLLQC